MRSLTLEATHATRLMRGIAGPASDCAGMLRATAASRRYWLAAAALAGLMVSPAVAAENTVVKKFQRRQPQFGRHDRRQRGYRDAVLGYQKRRL